MARQSKAQQAATPADHRTTHNSLVTLVLRGAAIGLLALVVVFSYLIFVEAPRHSDARMQAQISDAVAIQAQLIDQVINRWQFRVLGIARDPELIDSAVNDPAALPQRERALRLVLPEAISVRLVPLGRLGIANLRLENAGLRNHIEMDMLRRISDGATIPPESYTTDRGQLITFAQPIVAPEAGYAAAGLLISLPAGQLGQWLDTAVGERGEAMVVQRVGQQEMPLASVGSGDRTDLARVASLAVPNWQLQFTPDSSWLAPLRAQLLPLWLSLAATLTAALLGCLLIAADLRRALKRNLDALSGDGPLDLPGFAAARQQLLRRTLAPAPAPAPEAPPAEPEAAAPPAIAPATAAALPDPLFSAEPPPVVELNPAIFRAYDIRGVAERDLPSEAVYLIGQAIGSEAVERGQQQIVVGCDGRASSARIAKALIRGLQETGRDVIDIGLVPTPVLYFATIALETHSGVMVTGSHNPADDNGLKIVLGGRTLSGNAINALRERIERGDFSHGRGSYRTTTIDDRYIDYIVNDVAIAQPLKVVIDAGNGAAGDIAPRLFEALGCEVVPLFCDIDPRFPNHHPDPTVAENLRDLQRVVVEEEAHLGIAFDGDADRIGVVTGSGRIIEADRLLMLLAQDVVARNPGADVVFDVKCSRLLNTVISSFGGRPIMWKSGHSYMKEKMAETGALVGGEFSGHIFFNERWFGFDDGLYAGARLIEILSTSDPDLDRQLDAFPATLTTPEIKVPASDTAKFDIVAQLVRRGEFGGGRPTTLDGIRVDFPDGWGLVRASNTTPALVLRFEADDEAAMARLQTLFRDQLRAIDPSLEFGF